MDGTIDSLLAGLTFYHRVRMDEGIQTGISRDRAEILERFEIVGEEYDPYVAWYVELRCEGQGLPEMAEEARQWFLELGPVAFDGLERLASSIEAGSDPTAVPPLIWSDFSSSPPGVAMKLVTGALRQDDAHHLPDRLRSVGRHWTALILGLESTLHEAH